MPPSPPERLPSSGHVLLQMKGRGNQDVFERFQRILPGQRHYFVEVGELNPHARLLVPVVGGCFCCSRYAMPFVSTGSRRTASNVCHRVRTVSNRRAWHLFDLHPRSVRFSYLVGGQLVVPTMELPKVEVYQ